MSTKKKAPTTKKTRKAKGSGKKAVKSTPETVEREPDIFAGWDELTKKGKTYRKELRENPIFSECHQDPSESTLRDGMVDACRCTDTDKTYTTEEISKMNDATLDEVKKVNLSFKCPGQVTEPEHNAETQPAVQAEIGYDIPDYVMNDIIRPASGSLLESDIKVNEEFVLRRMSRISDCMVCINIGRKLDEIGSGMRIAYTRHEGKATYCVHAEFDQVSGIENSPNAAAVYDYIAKSLGMKK